MPRVTVPQVGLHPRLDVVVRDPDGLARHAVLGQGFQGLLGQELGTGGGGRRGQRADQRDGAQRGVLGLNDVGFSLAPNAVTYWVGEAMHGTDYQDLDKSPEKTAATTRTLAANTAHLARRLKRSVYPPT